MQKLDEDQFRAQLKRAWNNAPVPDDPVLREKDEMMRRAIDLNCELAVFGIKELQRHDDDPINAIKNIAEVLGNNLHNICGRVISIGGTDMDGPHTAIHILCEHLSATLHGHYYAEQGGSIDSAEHTVDQFLVPFKEVGDA